MPDQPVVVGLGPVDPALVSGVLGGRCRFVATPGDAELAVAAGAIVRADARVDFAGPGLRQAATAAGHGHTHRGGDIGAGHTDGGTAPEGHSAIRIFERDPHGIF